MSIFGFNTQPSSGGDFTPIIKYDARAGRIFRMDRLQDSSGNYATEPVDITASFKAMIDLENIETGWIDFSAGSAPSFHLIRKADMDAGTATFPEAPTTKHKGGVRFMLKLAKDCAGGQPSVREMAGTAKALLNGIEQLYIAYDAGKAANPGKLPAVIMEKAVPVKTGSGEKSSTNYHPTFKIVGWADRPKDLVPNLKSNGNAVQPSAPAGNSAAPSTGAQRAVPPQAVAAVSADDFG